MLIADVRARKRELGYLSGEADALLVLAVLAYRRGDLMLAAKLCHEGLPHALESGGLRILLFLIDRLAIIAGEVARADHAARLGGTVERLHEMLTTVPNPKEQPNRDRALTAARSRLSDEALAAAWAEGRRMRLEDAVAVGLAITPSEELLAAVRRRRLAAKDTPLSGREREVLCLVASGRTDQEIADALFLSRRTVNAHVAHVLTKLDVSTRREAVSRGRELGLLADEWSRDRKT